MPDSFLAFHYFNVSSWAVQFHQGQFNSVRNFIINGLHSYFQTMVRYHFRFYPENDFPRRVLRFSCIFGTLLHGEWKYLCFLLQESGNPLNTYKHECDIRILSVWTFGHILWSSYPSSLPVCFQTIVLNPELKQLYSTLMIFLFFDFC